jgi:hypothetical protein
MRAIIDAGAKNLLRARNDRQESYFAKLAIRRSRVAHDAAHRFHRAGGERCAQVRLSDFVVERNHAVIVRRSKPFLAVGRETQKLHAPVSSFEIAANILRTAQSICVTLRTLKRRRDRCGNDDETGGKNGHQG